MEKLTKIVATISDRKCDVEFISALYEEGMDVVRINTAHQVPEQTLKVIKNVRQVSPRIPVMIDTKGPEVRTNESEEDLVVEKGQLIRIEGHKSMASCKHCVYVNYPGFVNHLDPGKSS